MLKATPYGSDRVYVFSSSFLPKESSLFDDSVPTYEQRYRGLFSTKTDRLFSLSKTIKLPKGADISFAEVVKEMAEKFGPPTRECFNEEFTAHFAFWGYSAKGCPAVTPPETVPDREILKVAYRGQMIHIMLFDGKTEKKLRR